MVQKTSATPSRKQYDALVAAYLKAPADHLAAAEIAGTPTVVARKAWNTGWPQLGMPPIRDDVQQTLFEARLRGEHLVDGGCKRPPRPSKRKKLGGDMPPNDATQAMIDAEVEERVARALGLDVAVLRKSEDLARAKEEAVKQRMSEARMVQVCRANTTSSLVATSNLLSAALADAAKLAAELKSGEVQLTTDQRLRFIAKTAYLAESGARAAKLVVEMERVIIGDTNEIVEAEEQLEHISLSDAEHLVNTAAMALDRLKKRQGTAN